MNKPILQEYATAEFRKNLSEISGYVHHHDAVVDLLRNGKRYASLVSGRDGKLVEEAKDIVLDTETVAMLKSMLREILDENGPRRISFFDLLKMLSERINKQAC